MKPDPALRMTFPPMPLVLLIQLEVSPDFASFDEPPFFPFRWEVTSLDFFFPIVRLLPVFPCTIFRSTRARASDYISSLFCMILCLKVQKRPPFFFLFMLPFFFFFSFLSALFLAYESFLCDIASGGLRRALGALYCVC